MVQILFFRLDLFSFWLGFLLGLLFFWLGIQSYKHFPDWWKSFSQQVQSLREALNAGVENRLRNDIIHWAQRQHLAASLFSLDEVIVEPLLMAPPLAANTNADIPEDLTQLVIPYMPDWPEAAGVFGAPTLSLATAAQEGVSLVIMAPAGMGKTVALAHLAIQIARRDPGLGQLAERLPIILHAAELLPKLEEKKPLSAIIHAVTQAYASKVILPRLGGMLEVMFEHGRGLLLIDGMDEFDRQTFDRTYQYLQRLRAAYPRLQMIISTSPEYYGHLNKLGFTPMALAAWSDSQRSAFINRWAEKWTRHIQSLMPAETKVNPLLLKNWILTNDPAVTPLELTLKAWAVFSGDIIRPDLSSLLDAHLKRLTINQPNARPMLEKFASHLVLNQISVINSKEMEILFGIPKAAKVDTQNQSEAPDPQAEESKSPAPANDPTNLINVGLLVSHAGPQYRLVHPILTGYLAGSQLATSGQAGNVVEQPLWLGKILSLGFMSQWADAANMVTAIISQSQGLPIPRTLFVVARWLRGAPRNAAWRTTVMRELANTIQKEYHTPGVGARATVAIALSGDPNVSGLFRQLAHSDVPALRQLGVLGLGLCPDAKAISELAALIQDSSLNVGRAACLSLTRLATQQSTDIVISTLLHGSEEMRRAAAEALTNLGEEGLSILREAIGAEDLLVRRAAIFGLMRINHPEVMTLLEKTAIQDAQWVVRNAAAQALEQKKLPNPYIPKPLPPLPDTPWLISYAGKSGVGIANDTQGLEMLLNAIERGDPKERLLGLEMLRITGDHLAAAPLYKAYYSSKDEMREAAFVSIWHIMASGASLPSPAQFGLG